MPKPLATYINDLFLKAGVPADNQDLKDILSNAELSKVNIPDSLISLADAGIHTLDSAKAKLKNTLFTEALNGVDKEIESIINENEFDETTKNEIKAEKNTYKKVKTLTAKIQELEAKKHSGKGDTTKLQDEINTLKAQNSTIIKEWEKKLHDKEMQAEAQINNMFIDNYLSRYNYSLGDIDPEIKITTARIMVEKKLAESGAKIFKDPVKGMIISASDGTDFYDGSNNKVNLKSFIEGAIAPILSTTKDVAPSITPTVITGGQTKVNNNALDRINAEIAQLSQ